jgi:hypothetical protein
MCHIRPRVVHEVKPNPWEVWGSWRVLPRKVLSCGVLPQPLLCIPTQHCPFPIKQDQGRDGRDAKLVEEIQALLT